MRILMSACLLGQRCRYDGESKICEAALALAKEHEIVPVCPEQAGGLATPRPPAERRGREVVTKAGAVVTEAYHIGAKETLRLAKLLGCQAAVLKAKSPSCGKGRIYDGTFTGKLTAGSGVTAVLLEAKGIPVYTEEEIGHLIKRSDAR